MNKTEIKLNHKITALEDKISEILAEMVTLETKMNQEVAFLSREIASLDQTLLLMRDRVTEYHPQPPSGESA